MKMSDIKVGMVLRSRFNDCSLPIIVTQITEKGFKYSYDKEYDFIPREGIRFAKDGHEHFGFEGESLYTSCDE